MNQRPDLDPLMDAIQRGLPELLLERLCVELLERPHKPEPVVIEIDGATYGAVFDTSQVRWFGPVEGPATDAHWKAGWFCAPRQLPGKQWPALFDARMIGRSRGCGPVGVA